MKTPSKTLSIDSRFLHLYRPLVRRLAAVFVVTSVLVLAALLFFDERLVKRTSAALISNVADGVEHNLQEVFGSKSELLMIAMEQVENIPLSVETPDDELFQRLAPFLRSYPMLDSINVADTAGNEYALIRDDKGFQSRRIDASAPGTARWQQLRDGQPVETWERSTDTSPVERPWFKGAIQHEPGSRFWTEPYSFLTTEEPGISVSTRWTPDDAGPDHVIAVNISLVDITGMTLALHPSQNGLTFVFGEQGRVFGLPRNERFDDDRSILAASLLPLDQLGIPTIDRAVDKWNEMGGSETVFAYTGPGEKAWWAGFSRIELDEDHAFWSAVLVPRSDLFGALVMTRNLTIIGLISAGILLAALIFLGSMRAIRRQLKETVDRIEQKLGQYHIEERIGEGGNGTVYRARHALLRRPTALKLMNPEFARSDAARKRFEHEVRLTSGLSHPNTVAIYDFGRTSDGTLYYAMELLEGGTLNRLVQIGGPLPASRAVHLLAQACGSLAEAHSKGLIHRDIKPSNLIVCERGGVYDVVKVVDFGLVKEMAETDGHLTQADVLIGTPFYMAPEIISRPGAASPQSDLYALGAVGYYIVSGRQVFEGQSAVEICAAHLHDQPERPSARAGCDVPADLEDVLMRCLEKDPEARPADAEELRRALMQCADAGAWGPAEAKAWWSEFAAGLGEHEPGEEEVPMSRTELLVDLDTRLASMQGAGRSTSGR